MPKEDEIKLIAYNIWEQEDCPSGEDCEHWFRAEAIWEEQQKSKAVALKPEPKTVAQRTSKVTRAKKKS